MEQESFSDRNRRRRERNAFENLYEYNRRTGVPDPKRAAEKAARRLHGNGPSQAAEQGRDDVPHLLDDRTKEQLYERARELDVDGRSQMTRDELIEAIRKHT